MPTHFPWEYHADLTAERLIFIGNLIRQARGDALDRFNPSIGDDGWTIGCCAYKFCCFRIIEAAASPKESWLSIKDPSLRFIFCVGDIPVRFYRGPADEPPSKTCHVSYPELDQLSLAFPEEDRSLLIYRFAVETDFDGAVTAVKFVGFHDKMPAFCWEIPYEETMKIPFPPVLFEDEGVELAEPLVTLSSKDDQKDKNVGGTE